jgi:hypothetical protein
VTSRPDQRRRSGLERVDAPLKVRSSMETLVVLIDLFVAQLALYGRSGMRANGD